MAAQGIDRRFVFDENPEEEEWVRASYRHKTSERGREHHRDSDHPDFL
jgi:hypothetical protein